MFAAELLFRGEALVDEVGTGDTRDEALEALFPTFEQRMRDERSDEEPDWRAFSAWFDDATNSNDPDYSIRITEFK